MATTTVTMPALTAVVTMDNRESTQNRTDSLPHPSFYLTIDGMIRSHASEDSEIPMIGYPEQGVSDYKVHTAKTVDKYIDAACWWYQKQGLRPAVSTIIVIFL